MANLKSSAVSSAVITIAVSIISSTVITATVVTATIVPSFKLAGRLLLLLTSPFHLLWLPLLLRLIPPLHLLWLPLGLLLFISLKCSYFPLALWLVGVINISPPFKVSVITVIARIIYSLVPFGRSVNPLLISGLTVVIICSVKAAVILPVVNFLLPVIIISSETIIVNPVAAVRTIIIPVVHLPPVFTVCPVSEVTTVSFIPVELTRRKLAALFSSHIRPIDIYFIVAKYSTAG